MVGDMTIAEKDDANEVVDCIDGCNVGMSALHCMHATPSASNISNAVECHFLMADIMNL